jgi:DNA-binding NarL/FixJ family response regulator
VAAQSLPDVIVMEVRLSDGSGIEATRDIRAARPQTRVLMLTSLRRRRGPCMWPVR